VRHAHAVQRATLHATLLLAQNFRSAIAGTLALLACIAAASELGFSRQVGPALVAAHVARFGPGAQARLEDWVRYVARAVRDRNPAAGDPLAQIQQVNSYVNRVRFVSDLEHWGVEDYWATPSETFASGAGDCEDFSIAKYFLLKELGETVSRLRITYVRAGSIRQAHMVLAYYPRPDAEPLILDNLEDQVRPASARRDLEPVYSFNDEDLVLARSGRQASPLQVRAWRELNARLAAEARL
jgi:predicted transglutaminase-like cysteine proteinase